MVEHDLKRETMDAVLHFMQRLYISKPLNLWIAEIISVLYLDHAVIYN